MLVYISKCVKERVENVFHCLLPYFINKLYWYIAVLTHLNIVYDCFHTTILESSSTNKVIQSKGLNYLPSSSRKKGLSTPFYKAKYIIALL